MSLCRAKNSLLSLAIDNRMKENQVQRAVRQRDEVVHIISKAFCEYVEDEDNSWRVRHNRIVLEMQIERALFEYFMKMK